MMFSPLFYQMTSFSNHIIQWYEKNKRDLPWRNTKNPYLIWISEIILQQTRVDQGYDYYLRFVKRFPDVYSLASADEDEVLKYWQGLGYYSRARNLHVAAKQIVEEGSFPNTFDGVRALKGVGDYTAAAICSFAYDQPYAVVDGNVSRVLSRWLLIDEPIDSSSGKKMIKEAAQLLIDKHRPAIHNQAIMEFGALQCTPASPDCQMCPLKDTCLAFEKGLVDVLPVKSHKTKVTNRYFHYLFVKSGEFTFIHKRTGDDIWKNLYELPLIETSESTDEESFLALPELHTLLYNIKSPKFRLLQKNVKHVLSHRIIFADFYEVIIPEDTEVLQDCLKIKISDIHKFAVSRLINQFFSLNLSHNKKE